MSAQTSIVSWAASKVAMLFGRFPKLSFGILLLYLLSPIDIFPEAILGVFGYLDDVLLIAITLFLRRYGTELKDNRSSKTHIDTTAE